MGSCTSDLGTAPEVPELPVGLLSANCDHHREAATGPLRCMVLFWLSCVLVFVRDRCSARWKHSAMLNSLAVGFSYRGDRQRESPTTESKDRSATRGGNRPIASLESRSSTSTSTSTMGSEGVSARSFSLINGLINATASKSRCAWSAKV